MKQKSSWQIAKIVVCAFTYLVLAAVYHITIEIKFRAKFLCQDITAIMAGFKNHAAMIQKELDIRRTYILLEKDSIKSE